MEPTLPIGTRVSIKKRPLAIGSIVVFNPPEGFEEEKCGPKSDVHRVAGTACDEPTPIKSKVRLIRRIVAGPNDEIYIRDGHVYKRSHGSRDFIREKGFYVRACANGAGCNFPIPIKIPAGHWFLMGDNRGESDDSRFWGPVQTAWIIGTVTDYRRP
jgi:signal peptidase I